VEVDITHTDIDKNALYAKWRYRSYGATMAGSQNLSTPDGEVSGGSKQPNIPWVQQEVFYRFLEQCKTQGKLRLIESSIWVQENQAQSLAPAQT